ncbi:hypothetical protein JCM10212_001518 [Sporobolomyces blumeae]
MSLEPLTPPSTVQLASMATSLAPSSSSDPAASYDSTPVWIVVFASCTVGVIVVVFVSAMACCAWRIRQANTRDAECDEEEEANLWRTRDKGDRSDGDEVRLVEEELTASSGRRTSGRDRRSTGRGRRKRKKALLRAQAEDVRDPRGSEESRDDDDISTGHELEQERAQLIGQDGGNLSDDELEQELRRGSGEAYSARENGPRLI